MRVSVVIPTYQRRDLLLRALETLFAQRFPPEEYEVIVAVDGSTDGTVEMLRRLTPACRLDVVAGPNRGPAAARNAALARASGELALFLDDDILCRPDLLAVHAAAHGAGRRRIVFGPIEVARESPRSLATEWTREHTAAYLARLARTGRPDPARDAFVDANSSVPLAAVRAVGGFDPALFRQCETADLALRLIAAGAELVWEPRAIVQHVFVKSTRELVHTDAVWQGRNEVALCRRHHALRERTALGLIGTGVAPRRLLRRALASAPVSVDLLLDVPSAALERLRQAWPAEGAARGAGQALLRARQGIAFYRAAAERAGSWSALRREFGQLLPVLLYHYVGPRPRGLPGSLAVSAERFARDVALLARAGFTGIRAADWVAWRRDGTALPAHPVLVAFDDAYTALVEHALPALRRHGFGATVFAVAGEVGGRNRWDDLEVPLMDATQLRDLARQGVEIGAHGCAHVTLDGLSAGALEREVVGSRDRLADVLGAPVTSFAYPYGRRDAPALAAVRGSYACAFTTEPGLNALDTDPHLLRRSMVLPSDTPADLLARLALGWSPIERLRARLGALARRFPAGAGSAGG